MDKNIENQGRMIMEAEKKLTSLIEELEKLKSMSAELSDAKKTVYSASDSVMKLVEEVKNITTAALQSVKTLKEINMEKLVGEIQSQASLVSKKIETGEGHILNKILAFQKISKILFIIIIAIQILLAGFLLVKFV